MNELKLLIDMVANLPTMTLWVLTGFFVYKLAILGSLYGTIRFIVEKVHHWATHRHQTIELYGTIRGRCITADGAHDHLIAQLDRLRGKRSGSSMYVHPSDVDWLGEAINAKEQLDKEEQK